MHPAGRRRVGRAASLSVSPAGAVGRERGSAQGGDAGRPGSPLQGEAAAGEQLRGEAGGAEAGPAVMCPAAAAAIRPPPAARVPGRPRGSPAAARPAEPPPPRRAPRPPGRMACAPGDASCGPAEGRAPGIRGAPAGRAPDRRCRDSSLRFCCRGGALRWGRPSPLCPVTEDPATGLDLGGCEGLIPYGVCASSESRFKERKNVCEDPGGKRGQMEGGKEEVPLQRGSGVQDLRWGPC